MNRIKLAELMASLSHALDITEGQPEGHCIRACWIGMQIAGTLDLPEDQQSDLYYTILLKDLGCSSNAARVCTLYITDDLAFKRDFKWVDGSLPQILRFILRKTGEHSGLITRLRALSGVLRDSEGIARELIETRCTRGADIARQLRFTEAVALSIHSLDEHWNGCGQPSGLQGDAIPLYSRIAQLSQVVDIFNDAKGRLAACEEINARCGTWFDPELVYAFNRIAQKDEFWEKLGSLEIETLVLGLAPGNLEEVLDDDYLDDIAEAFGQVVDAKSPYTAGHSARVGLYTALLSESMGLPLARRRWLKRGALLHDVGKLGVSNTILDKPGKLDESEWKAMRQHAAYTHSILARISAFKELADVSSAHHERMDGNGYPLGLCGDQIVLETRIITTADIFDAITAERPYRPAVAVSSTLQIMEESVGTAIDRDCLEHLKILVTNHAELFPH